MYTVWIHYVYTMDTECIHLSKVSIYAACSFFGSLVFSRLVNQMATIWQPNGNQRKTPAFQPGLNVYFFDALYQLRYCIVCMIFCDAIYPTPEPLANILDLSVTLIILAGYASGM